MKYWIKLGIFSLAVAGFYSIFLVSLRAPYINGFFKDSSIFKTALILHVNMSILIWMMSIIAAMWNYKENNSFFNKLSYYISFLSVSLMALSPLLANNKPIMNNYIPILDNIIFIIGLSVFAAIMLLQALYVFFKSCKNLFSANSSNIIDTNNLTTSLMFIFCWICIYLSYENLTRISMLVDIELDYYYEMLFWSCGHLLQFIYTQIFIIILIILTDSLISKNLKNKNFYDMCLWLNFVLSVTLFWGHKYDMTDGFYKEFFTYHMIYFAALAPVLAIFALFFEIIQNKIIYNYKFIKISLITSIFLFLYGGLIGSSIAGVNVTIPAHYHGSTVGITIALMGFVQIMLIKYFIIDKTSGITALPNNSNLHFYLIAYGQIMHITGLALAGGYGVMRKTPGEVIAFKTKIYMGLVAMGGLIAIIGGLMFVIFCVKNYYFKFNSK